MVQDPADRDGVGDVGNDLDSFYEILPCVPVRTRGSARGREARSESGGHLEWNYIPTFEHLDAPFEIRPGIVIPPGSYPFTRYRVEVNTATKRPWVVDFALRYGSFYG